MGMFKMLSGGGGSSFRPIEDTRNPNPLCYRILSVWEYRGWLVVRIKYPNCTNFEGEKILVYRGMTENQLRKKNGIDPHFHEDLLLVARFQPTELGERLAKKFVITTAQQIT